MAAIGLRQGRKIRILEARRRYPTGILALLMHADGAVHAVVGNNDDDRNVVLHRSRNFLTVHHEVTVTGYSDHDPVRKLALRDHRSWRAVAHRARGRRELSGKATEPVVAMDPDCEIARAVADDG